MNYNDSLRDLSESEHFDDCTIINKLNKNEY